MSFGRRAVVVMLSLVLVAAVVALVWLAPPALYGGQPEDLSPAKRADAIVATRTAFVAGLAGLAALGTIWVNSRNVRVAQQNVRVAQQALEATQESQARTLHLQEQGHLTDRYTRAIEQLGDSDKLAVRLGGIYALERIAIDSERDHPTVVEVLSAFVRENRRVEARELMTDSVSPEEPAVSAGLPADIQAALTVLGRLPARVGVPRGDLSRADLTGAQLEGANFARIHLSGADLTRANLTDANLSSAELDGVILTQARLMCANLTHSDLTKADLRGAVLRRADLTKADLFDADLTSAYLSTANLSGAYLYDTHLTGAHLNRATCTATHFEGAEMHNCVMTGTDLSGAFLVGAVGLTQKQIERARGDSGTTLPEPLQTPDLWITT